jgi:hypothetical protein
MITTFLTMLFGATGPLNAVVLSKTFPERLGFQATTAAVMSLAASGQDPCFRVGRFCLCAMGSADRSQ